MDITLTTPALLFPAVTFLLVAYTNRFLALSARIRKLHDQYRADPSRVVLAQIKSLRRRLVLVRNMQACGVFGLFLCILCMMVLFGGWQQAGKLLFGGSLIFFLASLSISLREILLSVEALNIELHDMEEISKRMSGES